LYLLKEKEPEEEAKKAKRESDRKRDKTRVNMLQNPQK